MLWTVGFFAFWASALAAGIGAVVAARRRPTFAKKLLLGPVCFAGAYLAWEVLAAVRYAQHIPLDTQADHVRLQGYLTASAYYTLLFIGPLIGLCIAALRRLRAG